MREADEDSDMFWRALKARTIADERLNNIEQEQCMEVYNHDE